MKFCREGQVLYQKYNWYLGKYLYRQEKGKTIYFHREIIDAKENQHVDHINGNRLDNRLKNLRLCNRSQNMRNSKKRSNCTSRYKGVSFRKDTGKWQAYYHIKGKKKNIGCFNLECDAAMAYNDYVSVIYNEFARFNVSEHN